MKIRTYLRGITIILLGVILLANNFQILPWNVWHVLAVQFVLLYITFSNGQEKKGDGSIFIISFCLKEINSISRSAPGRKVENRNRK